MEKSGEEMLFSKLKANEGNKGGSGKKGGKRKKRGKEGSFFLYSDVKMDCFPKEGQKNY